MQMHDVMMWFLDFLGLFEKKTNSNICFVKSLDRFSPKFLGANNFFCPKNRWNHLLLSRSLALKPRFWLRLFLPSNHFFQPGETWGMLLGDGSFGTLTCWKLRYFTEICLEENNNRTIETLEAREFTPSYHQVSTTLQTHDREISSSRVIAEPILFPYHSHILRDSYGNGMGIVMG